MEKAERKHSRSHVGLFDVGEMEAILQAYKCVVPGREILEALAQRFSSSAERAGKVEVSVKQVLNWFQNRRYAIRNKSARALVPGQVSMPGVPRDEQVTSSVPPAPQLQTAPSTTVTGVPQAPQSIPSSAMPTAGRNAVENSEMEFEAKSARDGAWYDIACFLSHRSLETGDPQPQEALVRLSGFGEEEDEWVNIRRHVRQRSLPCESSECVAILPGDLVLCFQEGKEQALYFDAHILDAQRRRHDIRGCRCRFLVRYDHDQSEEIVPLRKICRRPETDYRLHQLYARKTSADSQAGVTTQNEPKTEDPTETRSVAIPAATESQLPPVKIADTGNATSAVENAPATVDTAPAIGGSHPITASQWKAGKARQANLLVEFKK
ncbi:protein SAWADEE HOMEODOMAIN HOMOLOG 2-like isoform X2 [Andrographis paniculata]|uniref:protein SAWADEE HOMEODOMAIN HOMOLOG 2-like isoform X2 n=1 Tax=Andrographis paniculata TaxID=175694 RepID=UPI0021E83677|nr:protein SAWADEE HOMEODOMAIN HOMOLOG 2-like isoform X2 [Andrographis paniculata]